MITEKFRHRIYDVYGANELIATRYVNIDERELRVDHYIDGNADVQIVVNGSLLSELVREPLFSNTSSVIDGTVRGGEERPQVLW